MVTITAAIMITTLSENGLSKNGLSNGGRWRLRMAAVSAIALSLLLLALGLPRLAGGLMALPGSATLWAMHEGEAVPPEAMASAAEGLARSARWSGNGLSDIESGYALMMLGAYEESRAATLRGLAAAPGNPNGWARLSWLRLKRGDRAGAASALRLSLLSGAVTPDLMESRLQLGLQLFPSLDPDTTALLQRQFRLLSALNARR